MTEHTGLTNEEIRELRYTMIGFVIMCIAVIVIAIAGSVE
jgi:hypothetical protein